MGFARCGVEGNLRKFLENTRKKPFRFLFFCNFEKTKMVFARDWFTSPLPVAVAHTSQSPFPLAASVPKLTSEKKRQKK
jgi:hypothetical protein